MSLFDLGPVVGKHCLSYCGDELCNCELAPRYQHDFRQPPADPAMATPTPPPKPLAPAGAAVDPWNPENYWP